MNINITVQVSIPVDMEFDGKPSMPAIRKAAIDNFINHPALRDAGSLEGYIDSIGNGYMDVTNGPCGACGGKGWLLADNCTHGLRIERCDACETFVSDGAAVAAVNRFAVYCFENGIGG